MKASATHVLGWALLVSLVTAGCVVSPDYPDPDAQLDPTPAGLTATGLAGMWVRYCPNIAGTYANFGDEVMEGGKVVADASLSEILLGRRTQRDAAVTLRFGVDATFEVDVTNDGVPVAAHAWPVLTYTREILGGATTGFTCHPGQILQLTRSISGMGGTGAMAISATTLRLSKLKSGELIVRRIAGTAGVITIVPVYRSESTWYRFSPLSDSMSK